MGSALTAFFQMVANYLGFAKTRAEEKNTADMVAAKQAQNEQDARDKTAQALKKHDLDQLRKDSAE